VTGFAVERDEASTALFDAAAEGVLLIRRCPVCGSTYPPYQRRCVDSNQLEWLPASGTAALITWAVEHAPPLDPALAGPDGDTSTFGLVELEEGPWLQVPLVGIGARSLKEGMPMRLEFIRPGDGEAIPAFTPL
jgi:uncharacterized OB-fold protein